MSFEHAFAQDISRRQFMVGAGAVLLGGATLLQGDIGPLEINHPADPTGLQPAERLTPPEKSIRDCFMPGALYRTLDVGGQKLVTLTFDDGPWPVNTVAIMDILARNGLEGCATFFQVADNVRQFAEIAREVLARGYTIGNHSKTHSTYVPSAIANEIILAQEEIFQILGIYPDVFRSPGLTEGQVIQDVLYALGMCNIFTDRDPHDWAVPRLNSQEIIKNVSNQLHPGLFNLLHDGGSHTPTVNAMQGIIDVIHEKGYKIVTLKQLFLAAAGQVLTTERVESYTPRLYVPDYSGDTFDRVAELAAIGLKAA